MLISREEDAMSTECRPEEDPRSEGDHSHEYQTASELFDMMAKNHPFEDVPETLSTRDLVILYKNIDLGTRLLSNAEEIKLKRPNQHVETVVYDQDQDSEGSEISEIYGNEDLHNVFLINKERLDFFDSQPSLENTLCQKLGDLELHTSNLSLKYDQHFLFKDPYVKEQLRNLNRDDGDFGSAALPASLLDYICCKRLEDNYNFYMDNIIRYVKHTIEQLKRISNGDYLTDRAKQKWREVKEVGIGSNDPTKVLATSTSIPLHVERKVTGLTTTWDDIIHSEVDVRSLSKILEKKIVVEIPKLICGSYKLFSKLCTDNLIISCKKEPQAVSSTKDEEPRLDVVLQLERSESGQVLSNISSIMILQPAPPVLHVEFPKQLSITYSKEHKEEEKKVKIIEIPQIINDVEDSTNSSEEDYKDSVEGEKEAIRTEMYDDTPNNGDLDDDMSSSCNESKNNSMLESADSSIALRDILDTRPIPDVMRKEAPYNFISPDDLSLSMHKLNMSALPEETSDDMSMVPVNKKKSPTKVRIKSPYENKSYIIEEKKRKRLLEIRERREKRKMAIGENCKKNKNRYGRGAITPQSSSSVTKLSITNKSFYNSIYGQNLNLEKESTIAKGRKVKRDLAFDAPLDQLEGELDTPLLTPEKNSKKYVNRSYYLDEAVTEMMYTELKQSECSSVRDVLSASSANSSEFPENMHVIKNTLNTPQVDSNKANTSYENLHSFRDECNDTIETEEEESRNKTITSSRNLLNVPTNSPKDMEEDNENIEKVPPTVECRKSIEKLYDLMNQIRKIDHPLEIRSSQSRIKTNDSNNDARVGQGCLTIQGSDSGTSLKRPNTSSNPSSFDFGKIYNPDEIVAPKYTNNKTTDALTTVVPKVIISTKQQTANIEVEKMKKDRKKLSINPLHKVADNPLKAISQILHEFDSVQKTRHKPSTEPKANKKSDIPSEGRFTKDRPGSLKRRSRVDQPAREVKDREIKEKDCLDGKHFKIFVPKERPIRPKPNPSVEPSKVPHQQIVIVDKNIDRTFKKKIADILDEVKEAKGEAVRGPSKSSRLNTLAQPKKSYVQAHSEEYQTKYGRNLVSDRLQRLAAPERAGGAGMTPASAAARGRPRRGGTEAASSVSVRPPPLQPLERRQACHSAGSSPEGKAPDFSQGHATEEPETRKNKIVAVESYINSHYGRLPPPTNELLQARVPLVPNDLDIGSAPSSPTGEESAAIGSKLHRIIDSILNPKPPSLAALIETLETSSNHTKDDAFSLLEDLSHDEPSSIDSDYRVDIFKDKNVRTAVQFEDDNTEELDGDSEKEGRSIIISDEIQKLEEALHARVSVGTFPNRLRMKKLTLTPKPSMQQVLLWESGDAGSLVLRSTMSQSIKSSSWSDEDIRTLPCLDKSHMTNWNFTNIPMQVSTVGYAFPKYNTPFGGPSSAMKSLENIFNLGITRSSKYSRGIITSDKTSQFKGNPESQTNHIMITDKNEADASSAMLPPKENQMTTASGAKDVIVNNDIEKTRVDSKIAADVEDNKPAVEEICGKANFENVDCTSSLDMLVGILNEIQNITTCHMTDTERYADEQECKELEILLNNAQLKNTVKNSYSHELVSIASLDKLRQLESSPSIYSMYLSNDDKDSIVDKLGSVRIRTSAKSVFCNERPSCADKEVSAEFPLRVYTDTFTEVPSKFFPMTLSHSTNVTKSLVSIEVLQKSSSQTAISLRDNDVVYSESTFICEEIKDIDISKEITNYEIHIPMIEYTEKNTKDEKGQDHIVVRKKSIEVRKVTAEITCNQSKCYVKSSDFDPLFKMKRDILVTMYSMLVLTVFAALSFPEILYNVYT